MVEETAEERQEIDPVFKQIVEDAFAAYKATCQTQYEVGRLPRTIDALVTIENRTPIFGMRMKCVPILPGRF